MLPDSKMIETVEYIRHATNNHHVDVALVLGSGLGNLSQRFTDIQTIPYNKIPNFPLSTVHGHSGTLIVGKLNGVDTVAMKGRFHLYEGYAAETVTFPIQVMHALGAESIIISNAAGGINETFHPGDLMLISDHINLFGINPLVGKHREGERSRFVDMSDPYDALTRLKIRDVARELGVPLREGVYAGVMGPSYETAAEVKHLRVIGADAVGMSTVLETIMAKYLGMTVVGISCITNMGSGVTNVAHTHQTIVNVAKRVEGDFGMIVENIVPVLARDASSEK